MRGNPTSNDQAKPILERRYGRHRNKPQEPIKFQSTRFEPNATGTITSELLLFKHDSAPHPQPRRGPAEAHTIVPHPHDIFPIPSLPVILWPRQSTHVYLRSLIRP